MTKPETSPGRKNFVTKAGLLSLLSVALAGCGRPVRPEPPISVTLVPLGKVSDGEVSAVRRAIEKTYRARVTVGRRQSLPISTYYPPRHRYRADRLAAWLEGPGTGEKVLGLTRVDISVAAHGHADWGVGGFAGTGKRAGVVSSFRTKGDLGCLGEIAVHELGHTLGRPHCPTPGCTMHDRGGTLPIGKSRIWLCDLCRRQLAAWLR